MYSKRIAVIDSSKCTYCEICLLVCSRQAIRSNFENDALRGRAMGRGMGVGSGLGRGGGEGLGGMQGGR